MNESVKDFISKGGLGKVFLILVIVVGGFISWRAINAVNANSGFKPAIVITPAQQTAETEEDVKQVEANPQMPAQTKQGIIAMLRAHEPGNTVTAKAAQ
jgi:hypothetical protein